jgi:hypothetical protein
MRFQRGFTTSGLIFWGFILFFAVVLGMKIAPSAIEYFKINKDIKAVAAASPSDATVSDIRKSFDKYAEVDHLDFKGNQLDISKDGGRIVIEFQYEKRIHLFYNVSLVIDYKGSTAGQ